MKELGKLHLHLLSLEHVILGLLADGGDLVKLPCNRVRFLKNTVVNFSVGSLVSGGSHPS